MFKTVLDFSDLETLVETFDGYHPKGPFPLSIDALREDTIGWDNAARWRYLCVLEHMFHQGGYIPDDPSYIAELIGTRRVKKWESKTSQVRLKLMSSAKRNGCLTNKHILRDVIKAFKRSDLARSGGKAKAANRLLSVGKKSTDSTISVEPKTRFSAEPVELPLPAPPDPPSLETLPPITPPSNLHREGKKEPPLKMKNLNRARERKESLVEGNGFDPDGLMAIWNEVMGRSFQKIIKLTPTRKQHLRCRMQQEFAGEVTQWRVYLERIKASPFLSGDNDRGWRADFNWAVNQTNAMKVLEGNYDERVDGRPNTPYEDALARWFGAGEPPDEKPRPEDYQ